MKTQCPHCNAYFNSIDESLKGQIVMCSNCNEEFVADDIEATAQPPQPAINTGFKKFFSSASSKRNPQPLPQNQQPPQGQIPVYIPVCSHWTSRILQIFAGIIMVFSALGALSASSKGNETATVIAGIIFFSQIFVIAFAHLMNNVEEIVWHLRNRRF